MNISTNSTKNLPVKKQALFMALTISFVTFLVYLPSLKNDFVNWDDGLYVYENQHIRLSFTQFFKEIFTSSVFGYWHPVTIFSFFIDFAIWGVKPIGFHLTNIIFHSLNTFFVFIVSFRLVLFRSQSDGTKGTAFIASLVTALLFGLHPLHVESVAWISERKDVLYSFFFLLSILSYITYASKSDSGRRSSYFFALFYFTLSLLSKPMAITLPVVLLVLDFFPLNRLQTRRVFIEKIPFILLALLVSLAAFWTQFSQDVVSTDVSLLQTRLPISIRAYMFYLYKMILPFKLSPFYPFPINIQILSFEYLGSFVLFAFTTFFTILFAKRNKIFLAAWIYYLVTLFPVIGMLTFGVHSAADRYTYLPALGLFFLAGLGVSTLAHTFKKKTSSYAFLAVGLVYFAFLSFLTVQQTRLWKNSITLWSHQIENSPDKQHSSAIAYYNRGLEYYRLKKHAEAVKDFNRVPSLAAYSVDLYKMKSNSLLRLGRFKKAITALTKHIELKPTDSSSYNDRGNAHFKMGMFQQAIQDYEKTIALNPNHSNAYYNLGRLYTRTGKPQKAAYYFNKAAAMNSQ